MRWFWIDKFVEFERGRRAVAIKNVSIVEEPLDDYLPGFPVMPNTLIIEGMAQTAGLLIGEMGGFEDRVVLAKIGQAVFHRHALPGDQLRYTATVQDLRKDGSIAKVTSHIGQDLQGEVELMFAFLPLDDRFPSGPLFEPVDFLAMVRAFGMYDVARTETGEPARPPESYLKFEREAQANYPKGPLAR
ncbi:MAG TPA: 3-hydroxyacyl-ACP dehydratase FabZ family protein [Pirellulaceae bacterium]|jgi:3-hydroxyacyl-[acyl-carrier-protein] dehydratase|nr:3-hydroxyacyl-ACP dehydratase FabZ family protein [Pirellulaceae bacterium]